MEDLILILMCFLLVFMLYGTFGQPCKFDQWFMNWRREHPKKIVKVKHWSPKQRILNRVMDMTKCTYTEAYRAIRVYHVVYMNTVCKSEVKHINKWYRFSENISDQYLRGSIAIVLIFQRTDKTLASQ